MIRRPAPVTAKPPPPPWSLFPLLYCRSTLWSDIYLTIIVPFRIIVLVPVLVATIFLLCFVACRDKYFPTVQTPLFFLHALPPFFSSILSWGVGAGLFDSYVSWKPWRSAASAP